MTKKDFEFIAETIKEIAIHGGDRIVAAKLFSNRLAQKNPRFKRDVFLKACGIPAIVAKSMEKCNCHLWPGVVCNHTKG